MITLTEIKIRMDKTLKVQKSINGLGVFAGKSYKLEQVIVEITGNILHWKKLLKIGGIILDNTFRYDKDYYLSPDGIGNYLNHSCEPNAGIIKENDKLFLKAIKTIKPGTEITFDYSTIIAADDSWTLKCSCKTKSCRKKIVNFQKLPLELRTKYLALGVVPIYILESQEPQ